MPFWSDGSHELTFVSYSFFGYALAPHLACDLNKDFAYLLGLHAARPSAFVEGVGLEPHVLLREQIYSLPLLTTQPTFQISCFLFFRF